MAKKNKQKRQWYCMDLHLHTPGSSDYHEPSISYLDILHQAEARNLDIIAFTDHNTVRGYAQMMEEIEKLAFLVDLGRAEPDEERRLAEYERLLKKILVLPGFEFTAAFGFHILGIFSPDTPLNYIEHILLDLEVSQSALENGDPISGSNMDVLTAYRVIHEAGGIVIAAHVNGNNGVMMLDKNWGGQTRIAYTQDQHLHALEVTDLAKKGRRTTARFFDGSKPEYPRRMRCIQGSDAHRLKLSTGTRGYKNFGVGDRVTEVSLATCSFDALLTMFATNDFARTRPHQRSHDPYDHIQAAREEGSSIVQAFHEQLTRRGGHLFEVLADICAMANTNGGTIYIGVNDDAKKPATGVTRVSQNIELLYAEVDARITPKLEVDIDTHETQSKSIIRVSVPKGTETPYAIDENKFFVRDDTETSLAVRDEIVQLILRSMGMEQSTITSNAELSDGPIEEHSGNKSEIAPPQTGVEVILSEKRSGRLFHTVRDLRNSNTVHNVTRKSARHLWHYAIIQHESHPVEQNDLDWHGDIALIKKYQRGNHTRYDLAQLDNGNLRVYYGVTSSGMNGMWQRFIDDED